MRRVFLSFRFEPIDTWPALVQIEPPSNYKDPEKIAAYYEKRRAELAAGKAATMPLCGSVAQMALLGEKPTPDIAIFPGTMAALVALKDFASANESVVFYGYQVRLAFRLLAIEAMRHAALEQAGRADAVKGLQPVASWLLACLSRSNDDTRIEVDPMARRSYCLDPVSKLFGSTVTIENAMVRLFDVELDGSLEAEAHAIRSFAELVDDN